MIDWERVNDLQEEIGADDFEEIVALFREEVEAVLDRLRPPASADRLEEELHFLKGSALNLGFRSFARLCQDGERLAAEGRPDQVDLIRLISVYAASWQVFTDGRSQNVG